jgi:hypothetical protein
MSRRRTLAVAALVVLSGVGVAGLAVPTASANANISGVSVSPSDPVTGERITVTADIGNLESANGPISIERVSLRKASGAETYTRVSEVGAVAPGGSISVPLTTSFEDPGQKRLEVSVLVREPSGAMQGYEYPISFDVSELRATADLTATTAANRSTTVTFENVGNVNASDIELTGTVGDEVLDRRYLAETGPGAGRSITFDTDGLRGEEVTFTAEYVAEGDPYTVSTTHTVKYAVPGEIRLTGVEATRTGGGVTIDGDAANVGGTDAESVLLSVRATDGVSPAPPAADYYLGTIEVGEFSTFELTAEVEPDVSSIPVNVTYIVDNDRITTTQEIELETTGGSAAGDGESGGPESGSAEPSSGGPPLSTVVSAVALLVVGLVGIGLYRRRKR